MLLIQPLRREALGYYFIDTERVGVDTRAQTSGRLAGRAAARLGLFGEQLDESLLGDLLAGIDPRSGEILDTNRARVRYGAFDCVFTVPKSVSLLYALGEDAVADEVVAAHEHARDGALQYLEAHACFVKTTRQPRTTLKGDGLLWGSFCHHTSRAGDPHLHSHVLIANLVPSMARGWSALDAGPLLAERAATARLYDTSLRGELVERLGVSFRDRTGPVSDVANFSDRVIDAFSTRQREIAARSEDRQRSFAARRALSKAGRAPKQPQAARVELARDWSEAALNLGLAPSRRPRLSDGRVERPALDLPREIEGALADFDRPFTRPELLKACCDRLADGAPAAQIEQGIDAVLGHTATVVERPFRYGARWPRGLGRSDRRLVPYFATEAILDAIATEARELRGALDTAGVAAGRLARSGGVALIDTVSDPTLATSALVAIGQGDASGMLRVIGGSARLHSHLEATTGLEVRHSRADLTGEGSPLLVLDANRLGVATRVLLLEQARRLGPSIVLCDLDWHPRPKAPTVSISSRDEGQRPAMSLETTTVYFVPSVKEVITTVRRIAEQSPEPIRIIADLRLSSCFADLEIGDLPSRAPLLVVGDARMLKARDLATPRQHVLVRPHGAPEHDLEALALAIASPLSLVHTMGQPRQRRVDRLAWGHRGLLELRRGSRGPAQEPSLTIEAGADLQRRSDHGRVR